MRIEKRRKRALKVLKAAKKRKIRVIRGQADAFEYAETTGDAFCQNMWGSVNLCGTASCAGGLLVLDVKLGRAGLRPTTYPTNLEPTYEGEIGTRALAEFFELPLDASKFVFGAALHDGEKTRTLAETIRRLETAFKKNPVNA